MRVCVLLQAEEDEDFQTVIKDVEEGEDSEKGIPDFWLSALKNHTGIGELSKPCCPLLLSGYQS